MAKRISEHHLRQLRNLIKIETVIAHFGIPSKKHGNQFRFLCPICGGFHTATNPKTNLGRCFDCAKNYNPIDLTMREMDCSFLQAVGYLEEAIRQGDLVMEPQLS